MEMMSEKRNLCAMFYHLVQRLMMPPILFSACGTGPPPGATSLPVYTGHFTEKTQFPVLPISRFNACDMARVILPPMIYLPFRCKLREPNLLMEEGG